MIASIKIESDAHWHELRAKHVGGSETPALFGEHAQLTPFELWNIKAGRIPAADLSDNDRVFWGKHLEPAISAGVAAKTGWNIRKVRRYLSNPDVGLGGSLDSEIVSNERGPGVLEIKTADWLVAKGWEDGEPPLSYQLQVQSYLALTGRSWGCMAVLIGGNDLRLFMFDKRPSTIAIIEERVAEFWRTIRDGVEPKPDFTQDGNTISALYASTVSGKTVDLSSSNRLPEVITNYRAFTAQEKIGKDGKEAAKAEILTIVGDAEAVICGDDRMSFKMVAGTHVSYDRAPYRNFYLSKPKVAKS